LLQRDDTRAKPLKPSIGSKRRIKLKKNLISSVDSASVFLVRKTTESSSEESITDVDPVVPLWNNRTTAWRRTTPGYQRAQQRMLHVAAENDDERRLQIFNAEALAHGWAASTKSTLWTAMMTASQAIGREPSLATRKNNIYFKKTAMMAEVQYPKAMTASHMGKIYGQDPTSAVTLAIMIGFQLGQRIGDVLQLKTADVRQPNAESIAITFRAGKVVPSIGPFTIFLSANTRTANLLMQHTVTRKAPYIFVETNCIQERNAMDRKIKTALRAVCATLELRSIRRGGLMQMALLGHEVKTILQFSKHKTEAMLTRYLENGAALTSYAKTQSLVTNNIEDLWTANFEIKAIRSLHSTRE
ncbi:MAG: hypothetical protein ACRDF4_11240, partial [Rhabdochlamydiaceae bacterium]